MSLNDLPRPAIVAVVLLVGVGLLFVLQPQHSICQTEATSFQANQAGNLYPRKEKKKEFPPVIRRAREQCMIGNSVGACMDYFQALRRILDDLDHLNLQQCASYLNRVPELEAAVAGGLGLMIRLAWGDDPPPPTEGRFGFMEASEIQLFCRLRDFHQAIWGRDSWQKIADGAHSKLPGVARKFSPTGECENCNERPSASTALQPEELRVRSLASVNCRVFR